MPTQKTRQEIIDLLTKCGGLSYQNFVNLLYSIPFLNELSGGSFDSFISKFTGTWNSVDSNKGKYDVDYYAVLNNQIYRSTVNNNKSTPGASSTWSLIGSAGSFFLGSADTTTDPGSPTDTVLYIAPAGTYPLFGGVVITGDFGFITGKGSSWEAVNINIDLSTYLKIKNVLTMGSIGGTLIVDVATNGTVTTGATGQAWVQIGTEYLPISQNINEALSGTNSAGLNWLYYFRSTGKIKLFNFTSGQLPVDQNDAVLLAYMYNADINNLNTISEKNIKVGGFYKNRVCGSLTFRGRCWIDKINHKVVLSDAYYQSTGNVYEGVEAGNYYDPVNDPTPFIFEYDPGLILQSIVFDPERLKQGVNPYFLTGVGYAVSSPQQILIATIVLNTVTTDFNIDEVSVETFATTKVFYGQKAKSITGDGTVDIKSNGDVVVNGSVFMQNDDGNFVGVANGTNPLKAGSNVDGLNWVVYNNTNAKIYLVNYTGGGIDREIETVIGYMYNIDPVNLFSLSKISVNGIYHGAPAVEQPTGELLLPKKIFLESSRNLPVYKRSIMKNRTENKNELVVIKNGSGETDFNLSRTYVYGDYLLSPYAVDNNQYLGFASINNVNGDRDYINNVQIVKKPATTQTIKGQQIGDSLTNRGVSKYIANYLSNAFSSANITYNTFGTLDNSGKQGEGREGWTYSNFIGRDNYHHFQGEVIIRGNGGMNQNPFLKLADATDKANHPDWCFRNTGAQLEQSYTSDPDKTGNFYIFDYAWYMAQNSIPNDLQILTIALSTNDYSIYGSVNALTSCVLGLTVMISQIKSALPNIKIGVIPTPVYGSSEDGVGRFSQSADWINKSMEMVEAIANVDVIGVWAHMSSVFDFPYNNLGKTSPGNGTNILMKSDIIHFDLQGYLQYAPPVANWIINVV